MYRMSVTEQEITATLSPMENQVLGILSGRNDMERLGSGSWEKTPKS